MDVWYIMASQSLNHNGRMRISSVRNPSYRQQYILVVIQALLVFRWSMSQLFVELTDPPLKSQWGNLNGRNYNNWNASSTTRKASCLSPCLWLLSVPLLIEAGGRIVRLKETNETVRRSIFVQSSKWENTRTGARARCKELVQKAQRTQKAGLAASTAHAGPVAL